MQIFLSDNILKHNNITKGDLLSVLESIDIKGVYNIVALGYEINTNDFNQLRILFTALQVISDIKNNMVYESNRRELENDVQDSNNTDDDLSFDKDIIFSNSDSKYKLDSLSIKGRISLILDHKD